MKKRPVWFASGNLVSKDRLEINTCEKYLDLINTMERGDYIVFKNTRNKSSKIPFETHGKLVSVMEIRGFGRIKKKPIAEEPIDIEWERINCSKEWYLFTFIKNLYKVDGDSKNFMYQELLKFIFNDQPQDIARFINEPYWKRRYSPGNEYAYQCEIYQGLKNLGGEGTLSQIQEEIKERNQLEEIKNNENWEAEVYRTLQKFSSDSKSFLEREDLYYRRKTYLASYWGLRIFKKEAGEAYSEDAFLCEFKVNHKSYENIRSFLQKEKRIIIKSYFYNNNETLLKHLAFSFLKVKDERRVMLLDLNKQVRKWESLLIENSGYEKIEGGFEENFVDFCKRAFKDKEEDYYFVIKGMHYKNLNFILEDLMFIFKRNIYWNKESLKEKDIEKDFFIPDNVYALGFIEEKEGAHKIIDAMLMRHFPFMDYGKVTA